MKKKCNETPIRNMIYHTEQPIWKEITPEHKGYRTALWNLVCDNMYVVGDYYIPADELFFNTSILADEVLEGIIKRYDFTNPKRINVIQPRYEKGDKVAEIMDIPDYIEENEDSELLYTAGSDMRVVITKNESVITIAIL